MPVAWDPTRWWDWCMSEYEKKMNSINFYRKKLVYNLVGSDRKTFNTCQYYMFWEYQDILGKINMYEDLV